MSTKILIEDHDKTVLKVRSIFVFIAMMIIFTGIFIFTAWLRQAGSEYPVLALTSAGLECLKDETRCSDLRLARQRPLRKTATRARSRAEAESWEGVDRDLFDRLRAVRLEIAKARGVPPYVIFHDATLRDMARLRPTSLDALLGVKGVGARKADDLGETFLAAIRSYS